MGKVKATAAASNVVLDGKKASNVTSISAARPKAAETAKAPDGKGATNFEPALVLFGRDQAGKCHASVFAAADAELALKAAGLMRYRALPIQNDNHRAAALGLPQGRVFGSGRPFSPFCREAAYEALEAFSEAFLPPPPEPALPLTVTNTPQNWKDIGPGSLVLASIGEDSGWFESVIIESRGDDIFVLRWRGWPDDPEFVRRRDGLALLPIQATEAA